MNADEAELSKFLSCVLRHKPESIGLTLDAAGWANIDELLAALASHGQVISLEKLLLLVRNSDKKRFALSEDGLCIRASQGHSLPVDLGYEAANPPEHLYHGTATRFLSSIRAAGLKKQSRQHVHLSADRQTASLVGIRHGKPAVLVVNSGAMAQSGHQFFLSANGVWLTESVPPDFIEFPESDL